MGCCSLSRSLDNSEEEALIFQCESLLGFSTIPPEEIIDAFTTYSEGTQISECGLAAALSDLNISCHKASILYSKLSYNKLYSLRKLKTLAILLGSTRNPVKLRLLFENYDSDGIGRLGTYDIEKMISHILYISLSAIPEFSIELYKENQKLSIYSAKLQMMINALLKHFSKMVISFEIQADYLCFLSAFKDKRLMNLLKGKKTREYCYELFNHSKIGALLEKNPSFPKEIGTHASLISTNKKSKTPACSHLAIS